MDELLQLYNDGAISDYQLAVDALQMLDPMHPELVLAPLPAKILDEILDYAGQYDPKRSYPKRLILPAVDQVETAVKWIKALRNSTGR